MVLITELRFNSHKQSQFRHYQGQWNHVKWQRGKPNQSDTLVSVESVELGIRDENAELFGLEPNLFYW